MKRIIAALMVFSAMLATFLFASPANAAVRAVKPNGIVWCLEHPKTCPWGLSLSNSTVSSTVTPDSKGARYGLTDTLSNTVASTTTTDPNSKGQRYGAAIIGDKKPMDLKFIGDSMWTSAGTNDANTDACDRGFRDTAVQLRNTLHPSLTLTKDYCWGAKTTTILSSYLSASSLTNAYESIIYVGVDDAGFPQTMIACSSGLAKTCQGDINSAMKMFSSKAFYNRLVKVYTIVRQATGRRVFVPSYMKMVTPGVSCYTKMTASEQVQIDNASVLLNSVILKATKAVKGVTYVDMTKTFQGHEMCTKVPYFHSWVINSPLSSFHPTPAGKVAIINTLKKAGA